MAKWEIGSGCENYIKDLEELEMKTEDVLGRAIYEGAKIVTDRIRKNIDSIPIQQGKFGKSDDKLNGITSSQKQGLKNGLGIASLKNENGYVHVKVGMDGYNATSTKKYPNGQPNAMIARSVESGTSFRKAHRFIEPAVYATQKQAEEAMAKKLEDEIYKKMNKK